MTHFDTYLFSVGTHWGNLLVSSRFSTGDLNFCVHSIPLWEPCVEKTVMLRASMHIGLLEEHCSNYIMPMLNLQIHQWASSRQHQCGIRQNKLSASQSGLRSCLDEWLHLHVHLSACVGYTPGYACTS